MRSLLVLAVLALTVAGVSAASGTITENGSFYSDAACATAVNAFSLVTTVTTDGNTGTITQACTKVGDVYYTGTCSNAQGEQKASYNAIAYGTDANCAMGSVTGSTAQAQDTSVCVKLSGSALYAKFSSCDVNSAAKALLSFSAVLMMAFAFFAKQL